MLKVEDARALVLKQAHSFGVEKIPLEKSFGRILAEDIRADRDYPPFNRSAMDGYAIYSAGFTPEREYRVTETIFAGDAPPKIPKKAAISETAIKIMTGAGVPAGFDAVVRREDAKTTGDVVSFLSDSIPRWNNISQQGEDLKRGGVVSLAGHAVDQSVATLLASLGVARPGVQKLPGVAIVTTGNEIIPAGRKPKPQQIRNSNVVALRSMLARLGIADIRTQHVADDKTRLQAALKTALRSNIVLLTGGVSAGDSDYVPEILKKLKVKEIFHKTAMKPGKPLWFGTRGNTAVFAIPGNPFSAQVVFKIYVAPFLCRCFGAGEPLTLKLPLAAERQKKDQLRHYFPVRVANRGGSPSELEAVSFNGSGDIRAGLGSDGLAIHPADKKQLSRGEIVEFIPW